MINETNKYFEQINTFRLVIESLEEQRRNTWKIEERDKFNIEIKKRFIAIDDLLDQYNSSKKFTAQAG